MQGAGRRAAQGVQGARMSEAQARELAEFEENMLIGNVTDDDGLAEDDGMDMAEFEAAMNRGRQEQEGEDYEWSEGQAEYQSVAGAVPGGGGDLPSGRPGG